MSGTLQRTRSGTRLNQNGSIPSSAPKKSPMEEELGKQIRIQIESF
jgi:hypothetical protein